jgi:hypothetical protein
VAGTNPAAAGSHLDAVVVLALLVPRVVVLGYVGVVAGDKRANELAKLLADIVGEAAWERIDKRERVKQRDNERALPVGVGNVAQLHQPPGVVVHDHALRRVCHWG